MTETHLHHRVIQIDFTNKKAITWIAILAVLIMFQFLEAILCVGFGAYIGMRFKGPHVTNINWTGTVEPAFIDAGPELKFDTQDGSVKKKKK